MLDFKRYKIELRNVMSKEMRKKNLYIEFILYLQITYLK